MVGNINRFLILSQTCIPRRKPTSCIIILVFCLILTLSLGCLLTFNLGVLALVIITDTGQWFAFLVLLFHILVSVLHSLLLLQSNIIDNNIIIK